MSQTDPSEAKASESISPDSDFPRDGAALKRIAIHGAAWLGFANVVAKGAQILVTLALARFLSPAELGLVSLTSAVLNIAGLVQTMGLFDVVTRTSRDPDSVAGTLVVLATTVGTVLGAAGYFWSAPLADTLHAPAAADLLRAVSACLPFMAYGGVQLALMAREYQFRRRVISDGGSAILGAGMSIALMAAGWGPSGAIAGVIATCVTAPALAALMGVRIRPRWSWSDCREALAWASVAGPGGLVGMAILNVDYVVITRIAGEASTGIYSLAYRIAFVPYIVIAFVVGGVAFPIMAQLHREGRREELQAATIRFLGVSSTLVMMSYTIIFVAADQVTLLGDRWSGAVDPLRILCLYGIAFSINVTALDAFRAVGAKHSYLWVQVFHMAALIVLIIPLTVNWGVAGTSWAQAVAAACTFAASMMLLRRALLVSIRRTVRILFGPALVTAILLVVNLLIGPGRLPVSLLMFSTEVALSAAAFIGILAIIDRDSVRQLFPLMPTRSIARRFRKERDSAE